MHRYKVFNGPMPTAAAQAKVATGTAIKTMLQIATPATRQIQLLSWGFTVDVGQGGEVELLQTDVAATVTAHVASGIVGMDPNVPASLMTLGVAATGYTASAEGAIAATRVFDVATVQGGGVWQNPYVYQFTPAERAIVAVSKFLRVRATFGTTTNLLCWVCWDE